MGYPFQDAAFLERLVVYKSLGLNGSGWIFLTISCFFVLVGGAMAVLIDEWLVGLLIMGFFGTCAAMFAWQLLLVAKKSKT